MRTGRVGSRWQQASGWFIIFSITSTAVMIGLLPAPTAHALGAAANLPSAHPALRPASAHPALRPASTPVSPPPTTITPTPNQGPVGTLVTLQGTGWSAGSQVLISYDNDPGCASPNLTELSPDPKPTVSDAGTFSVRFSWPAVSATGFWYICAATSDATASGAAVFTVLSLSAPSLTILTKGPFLPGHRITVQGKNWFPGGWSISFALQQVRSTGSFFLEESVISRFNGTFDPTSITIPPYLPPGSYFLIATMEQQALVARSGPITIAATPTPTPTATPSPSPTPLITLTPTPTISLPQPPSTPHRLSGPLLALVIISGGMTLFFALIGTALFIYLRRSRPVPSTALALERRDETRQI